MVVTLLGIIIELKDEQPIKAPLPIKFTFLPIVSDGIDTQFANASPPIVVTLSEIIMESVKDEHPAKAKASMEVIFLLMETERSEVQSRKEPCLITVTLFGIIMEVNFEQPLNASFPMAVKFS